MRNGDRVVVAATGRHGEIVDSGTVHNAEKASDPFAERLFPVHLDDDPDGFDFTFNENALVPEGQWEDVPELSDEQLQELGFLPAES